MPALNFLLLFGVDPVSLSSLFTLFSTTPFLGGVLLVLSDNLRLYRFSESGIRVKGVFVEVCDSDSVMVTCLRTSRIKGDKFLGTYNELSLPIRRDSHPD